MNSSTNNKQPSETLMLPEQTAAVDQKTLVIPVIDEQLHIDKQTVETGQVRISKTVREDTQLIDLPLIRETVDVERVPIGRPVTATPAIRQEGNTTIYPVLEEIVVVEKKLMLVEEIRVTTRQTVEHEPQSVTLRREEISVERSAPVNETERPTP